MNIKKLMNIALQVFGTKEYPMSESEKIYGDIGPMKKAIVAKKNIMKGKTLSVDNLCFKRTAKKTSIKQLQFPHLLGLKTKTNIRKDEIIKLNKLQQSLKF